MKINFKEIITTIENNGFKNRLENEITYCENGGVQLEVTVDKKYLFRIGLFESSHATILSCDFTDMNTNGARWYVYSENEVLTQIGAFSRLAYDFIQKQKNEPKSQNNELKKALEILNNHLVLVSEPKIGTCKWQYKITGNLELTREEYMLLHKVLKK